MQLKKIKNGDRDVGVWSEGLWLWYEKFLVGYWCFD